MIGLILPAFDKRRGMLAPMAAVIIAAEMLLFCTVHIFSRDPNSGPMVYWLVVAAISAFTAYGRLVLKPHQGLATEIEKAA